MAGQRKTRSGGNDTSANAELGQIEERNRRGQMGTPPNVPEVGLFFVLNGKLLLDGIPWTEGEHYGDCVTHPNGHEGVWLRYQRIGAVPRDVEYDEVPRGRVIFNVTRNQFYLLADRCILRDRVILDRIKTELYLPAGIEGQPDAHYRCPKCLAHVSTDED